VGEDTQDSDRIVALNKNGESLKEEGALAVITCAFVICAFQGRSRSSSRSG